MRGSIVKARKVQDQRTIAPEMFVQQAHANGQVPSSPDGPRIACKANGRISFLNLAEIVAVHAEGNYVSLQPRPISCLLRESLSSMAEKLKPYGFIRIHRSVIVIFQPWRRFDLCQRESTDCV